MTRMREHITTSLEVVGIVLLIAGVALFVAHWSVPAALIVAGLLAISSSAAISYERPTSEDAPVPATADAEVAP